MSFKYVFLYRIFFFSGEFCGSPTFEYNVMNLFLISRCLQTVKITDRLTVVGVELIIHSMLSFSLMVKTIYFSFPLLVTM